MQSYMFSYAHVGGFGRKFFQTNSPLTEDYVKEMEASLKDEAGQVVAIAITKIDGDVKPAE